MAAALQSSWLTSAYGTRDIWLLDIGTNALTRLTANAATDWRPVFSPDGNTLAFASDRAGASTVFRTAADGSGGDTVLYRSPDGGAFPSDWSRDGKHVLVQIEDSQGTPHAVSLGAGGRRAGIANQCSTTSQQMTGGRYSPEGDRVAFSSTATGSPEVYVMLARRPAPRPRVDRWRHRPSVGSVTAGNCTTDDQRGAIMLATLDSGPAIIRARPAVAMRPCVR